MVQKVTRMLLQHARMHAWLVVLRSQLACSPMLYCMYLIAGQKSPIKDLLVFLTTTCDLQTCAGAQLCAELDICSSAV